MGNTIIGRLVSDLIIPGENIRGEPLPDLSGDDIIDGVGGNNVIAASDGNDSVVGGSGNDTLHGNRGDDTLRGRSGNDTLYGGDSNDVLFGNFGKNFLSGDRGNDTIFGGRGNDIILGGKGEDYLMAGDGNDTLAGGDRNDTLEAGNGNDVLFGNQGDDVVRTREGNNTLYGGAGNDTLYAGVGRNFLSGDLGADVLVGGEGQDTFAMSRRSADLTTGGVNLSDADRIRDFVRGRDQLFLDGLPIEDISIEVDGNNSIIKDTATNQFLAVVEGVSDLDATDFDSEIPDGQSFEFVDKDGNPIIDSYNFDQKFGGLTPGDPLSQRIFIKRHVTTGEDELLFNKIPATALKNRDYQGPGTDVELLEGQRVVRFDDGEDIVSFDINLLNEVLGTAPEDEDDRFFSLQLKNNNVVVDTANFLIKREAGVPLGGGFTFTKEEKTIGTSSENLTDGAALGFLVPGQQDVIEFRIFRQNTEIEASVDVSTSTVTTDSGSGVTNVSDLGSGAGQGDFLILTETVNFGVGDKFSTPFQVPVAFDGLGSSFMQVSLQGDPAILGATPTTQVDIL